MSMTSIEPRRRSRRWIILGLALVAFGAVAYGVVDALKSCRWLDRLLGISGCIASHPVKGLTPLYLWRTLAVPVDGKTIVYFGTEPTEPDDAGRTTLVAVDAESGREKTRVVVVQARGALMAIASSDGQRTALLCESHGACIEGQHGGVIVSSLDGRRLATVATADIDTLRATTFPGDPVLPAWAGHDAIRLPGDLVASREARTDQVTLRRLSDRSEVMRLRDRGGLYRSTPMNTMAVSPNGRWLAILAESFSVTGKRTAHVFDLKSGIQVASLPLERNRLTLAWVGDDRLVIPRAAYSPTGYLSDATDVRLEIYAMPKVP
jgi:hypothetical protein